MIRLKIYVVGQAMHRIGQSIHEVGQQYKLAALASLCNSNQGTVAIKDCCIIIIIIRRIYKLHVGRHTLLTRLSVSNATSWTSAIAASKETKQKGTCKGLSWS